MEKKFAIISIDVNEMSRRVCQQIAKTPHGVIEEFATKKTEEYKETDEYKNTIIESLVNNQHWLDKKEYEDFYVLELPNETE